jgi:DNA polymerase I-like protein with 3'-5' exonuclease and polymerase domains
MSSITFWGSPKPSSVKATIGKTLQTMQHKPEHKFVSLSLERYVPAPDECVLVLGPEPLLQLAQAGIVHKGRTPDSLRGKVFQRSLDEGVYMVSLNPDIIEVEQGRESDIAWDVQLITRFAATGSLNPVLGDYRWVQDFSDIITRIEAKHAQTGLAVPVSGDIETLHLSPFSEGSRIVAVGFTDRAGFADLLYLADLQNNEQARLVFSQIAWLLNSPKVKMRGANFKFDMNWMLVKWGIDCTNFSMDTVLVGSLLNENRSNGLKNHVKSYIHTLGGYDDAITQTDLENMHLVPKDKMLNYLGGDVDGTYRVSECMLYEIAAEPRLANFYVTILHRGARGFQRIERQGVKVHLGRYAALRSDLEREIARLTREGLALLPARLRAKYADNLSLSRPSLLKDYFFSPMGLNLKPIMKTPKGDVSTARAHLEKFFAVPEAKAIGQILDAKGQAEKMLSTYVIGFLQHLHRDGKFHPSYFLHKGDNAWGDDTGGSVSGRLSATDPAFQTIPSKTRWAPRIRECIVADDGYMIVSADFEQGELKICACLANEPNMIAAYLAGIDLHMKTGGDLTGRSVEEMMELKLTDPELYDYVRSRAKPANFGIIYGISANGYVAYAWNGYRVPLTEEEAQTTIDRFFDAYPGLPDWHERKRVEVRMNRQVTSPLGRIRHLPHINSPVRMVSAKAERQAINSEVQSTLTDMMVWAIAEANDQYPDYAPMGMVHDNVLLLVKEDQAEAACVRMAGIMANLPLKEKFGWEPALKFTADAKFGPDLGHLKTIKI